MDCSPPGSTAHGSFQARVLEWGAIAFSEPELRQQIKLLRDTDTCLIVCVNSQLEQWLRQSKIMLPSIFLAKLFYFFSEFLFIFVVALWWEADKWLVTSSLLEKGKRTDRTIRLHCYKEFVSDNKDCNSLCCKLYMNQLIHIVLLLFFAKLFYLWPAYYYLWQTHVLLTPVWINHFMLRSKMNMKPWRTWLLRPSGEWLCWVE